MASKKELKNKIIELEDKVKRLDNYKSCEVCGGVFNKDKMKAVEVRFIEFPENPRETRYYCPNHIPKHDIEEVNPLLNKIRYKVNKREEEVTYAQPKETKTQTKPQKKKPQRHKGQPWTQREINELLQRLEMGESTGRIAREMGRDRQSVTSKYNRLGIRRKGNKYEGVN